MIDVAARAAESGLESPIDEWIADRMAKAGIKSAYRLAMEAQLDYRRVPDWLLGTDAPSDEECARLAGFFRADEEALRAAAHRLLRRLKR